MKYKNTNPFEQNIRVGGIIFHSQETKILPFKVDGFNVEEIEEAEKPKKLKGGK